LIVLASGTGLISLWLAVAITIVVLLAATLIELSRIARK
jgi:heme exporter protein D